MEMENIQAPRIRVNVSSSTKGVLTFDCTVEASGISDYPVVKLDTDMAEVLKRSDELVAELTKRYRMMEA